MDKAAKNKLLQYIGCFLVLVLLLWSGFWFYGYVNRPLVLWLTPEGLRNHTAAGCSLDGRLDGVRWEYTCADDLEPLFRWDQWEQTYTQPTGAPILIISMADEYDMEFYEGGLVYVFDGYASRDVVGQACYRIPQTVLTDLAAYFRQNATFYPST